MAIAAATKLGVFNGAIFILGGRKLASLSEEREPRRVLDEVWDGAVDYALARADWNFAMRSAAVVYSAAIETEFGFRRAFEKPDDFVRLSALSGDPYFRLPLTAHQYADEGPHWLSDLDSLFVRYVSRGDGYGYNSAGWPETFKMYLEAHLAFQACERITNSRALRADADAIRTQALREAKGQDAMLDGVKFPPPGSWVRSRQIGSSRIR